MLQDTYDLGQLDAKLVLGMLLMAEGKERKQEALNLLNDVYRITRTWNPTQTCFKVEHHLSREGRKHIEFHGLHKTCVMHP